MRIGIDISQLAYSGTGVSNYLGNLVSQMIKDENIEFVLFFSSLRNKLPSKVVDFSMQSNVVIIHKRIPPLFLHLMWNVLHKNPIENFIGKVDLFISSDWTEPPSRHAKKATILYDLIVYKYPEETHSKTEFDLSKFKISPNIVNVQKRKHKWVREESDIVFCISESTRNDAVSILGISKEKLFVIYPGY